MKIQDLLRKDVMLLDLKAQDKASAIDEMVGQLVEKGYVSDYDTFKTGILNREALTTTGLGDGIAMPHAKNEAVNEATVLFAKSANGLDYESLDGQATDLFFMIAAPEGANDTHLSALAALSKYLMKDGFADALRLANTPDQVIEVFDQAELTENPAPVASPDLSQESSEHSASASQDRPFLVAVTACTTGIAHTYMAEEALKKKAQEMGIEIKVETNGASGVGNPLTAEDISRAIGVIIAADKQVAMERFAGKPLLSRPVADGIKKTEELITTVLDGKAATYQADSTKVEVGDSQPLSLGGKFYKHLMSGVSMMLPFVIGGGILIALAFLIDRTLGVPSQALDQLGSYNEWAAIFMTIGSTAFSLMLPVLAAYIGYSIAEKPGFLAGIVAGMIANGGQAFGSISYGAAAEGSVNPLMSSGFLGAIVGGFLAGAVILGLKKALGFLPRSLEGVKSVLLLPLLGVLLTALLMMAINIPMSSINQGLNGFLESLSGGPAIIMGLVLGGMMAIDMGGPINKAAYVFGTGTLTSAALSSGGSVVMAAVMAAGMVPPLAVFFASVFFKNKFTQQERQSGLTNIIMGLSFITEGAIPYAAADPVRAIPSFVAGAALTGALVGLSGIQLMAPHGGIFVIALTSQPILYLVFILLGALVSGYLLGFFRKVK